MQCGMRYCYRMPDCVIYGLIDPRTTEVRYVGKTSVTVPQRLTGHYRDARRRTSPVGAWLLKIEALGLKPLWTVLEEAPADWQAAERKWIAYYRELYPGRMKNVQDGGEGGRTSTTFAPGRAAEIARKRRPSPRKPWTDEQRAARGLITKTWMAERRNPVHYS